MAESLKELFKVMMMMMMMIINIIISFCNVSTSTAGAFANLSPHHFRYFDIHLLLLLSSPLL